MFSTDHLHPMLVHFPIAIVIVGFLAECAALFYKKDALYSEMAYYLLLLGTLSATVALVAGALFTGEMGGAAGEVQEMHELFAWITLVLLVATTLLRLFTKKKKYQKKFVRHVFFCF